MFSIIKGSRPIKLRCYTNNVNTFDLFPITRARNYIPQWWKDIPLPDKPENTENPENLSKSYGLKGCPGIIEYYKLGFILPLWTDLILHAAGENKNFETYAEPADEKTSIAPHPPREWGSMMNPKEYMHFKINNTWLFECSESINWLYTQCSWNTHDIPKRVIIPTGHMDYKIYSSTNIQMFLERGDIPVKLDAGIPLMHIIPITERPVKIECFYDPEKYERLNQKHLKFSFGRRFYKRKKIFKKKGIL